jgi:hypothetical protein
VDDVINASDDAAAVDRAARDALTPGGNAGNVRGAPTTSAIPNGGSLLIDVGGDFSASELNAARLLASEGNNVILRIPTGTRAAGGTSDLLVNGVRYDVYTPNSSSANRIISELAKKNSQATRLILDLSNSSVRIEDLRNVLARVRGAGATNITEIRIIGR